MEKEKQELSPIKAELPRNVEIIELDDTSLEDIVGGLMKEGDTNCGCNGGDKNCGCL